MRGLLAKLGRAKVGEVNGYLHFAGTNLTTIELPALTTVNWDPSLEQGTLHVFGDTQRDPCELEAITARDHIGCDGCSALDTCP